MGRLLITFFVWLKNALTHRIWLKLLSLLLALVLWSYIINSNSSLTRSKRVEGLNVTVPASSNSELNSKGLALVTDVFNEYAGTVEATVEISQKEFYRASYETISVFADVSNIRTVGTHEVPLTAVTNKGVVTSLYPNSIKVVVDQYESREVPVQVELVGERTDNYWYYLDDSSVTPKMITVSGPSSLITRINNLTAEIDITGYTKPVRRAAYLNAFDSGGNVINKRLINKTFSTCTATVEVYPTKTLPLTIEESEISVAEGYEIVEIRFNPQTVTVADEQKVLDSLESLTVELNASKEPISATASPRCRIKGSSDYKYITAHNVSITIMVQEKTAKKTLTNVPIQVHGLKNGYEAQLADLSVSVSVSGPYFAIEALEASDIVAYVEASNLGVGTYNLPVYLWNKPDVSCDQKTPEHVSVTITPAPENDVSIHAEG